MGGVEGWRGGGVKGGGRRGWSRERHRESRGESKETEVGEAAER